MFRILTTEEVKAERKELLHFLKDNENYTLIKEYMNIIRRTRRLEREKLLANTPHCYNCLRPLPRTAQKSDLCIKCMKHLGITKVSKNKYKR